MIALAEITPEAAAILAWSTLILWIGIALPFFLTSVIVHMSTRDPQKSPSPW